MNFSNFTIGVNNSITHAQELAVCRTGANAYSPECLYKTLCPQLSEYFVTYGIGIIILVLLTGWVKMYFLKWGYKRFDNYDIPFIGKLHHIDTRIKIDRILSILCIMICLGYIAIVVIYSMRL